MGVGGRNVGVGRGNMGVGRGEMGVGWFNIGVGRGNVGSVGVRRENGRWWKISFTGELEWGVGAKFSRERSKL